MDEEKLEYSFTGDVSSLRQATEQAIDLLDKYGDQIKRLTDANAFGKNVKAAKSFNAAYSGTTKAVDTLVKKLGTLSDVRIAPRSNESQQLSSGIGSVQTVLNSMVSATQLTTAEVRNLTSQLKSAKQSFVDSGDGIDTLVKKELKFQQTLENVSAKSQKLRDTLDSVKSRVSGVFDPLLSKLNSLKAPFAQISQRAQSFKDIAANAFNRVSRLAEACTSAFRRVQQSEDDAGSSADRVGRAHAGLANILERLRNLFRKETEAIDAEDRELEDKNNTLRDSTSFHSRLMNILQRLGAMFRRESNNVKLFSGNLHAVTNITNLARKGLLALTGVRISDWLASAVKESISYVENLNLFTVAMGKSIDVGLDFVDTMSEIYGMDPSNLYRYAGYFYQLTDAIGMADRASAVLSLSLTKSANDIASLFNIDIQTVVDNLASGMQGMSRAVRKYGMDIRTVTLQQTAYNYGITDQVESMSEANRMALRYLTMMEQVRSATHQVTTVTDDANVIMGDFARTIESPANQLRIFKEQVTQLGRAIGNFLVAPLQTALPLINGFIMALRTALTVFANLAGFTTDFGGSAPELEDGADAVAGIGDAAAATAKKVKSLLGPFDELNILSANAGAADAGGMDILDPALEAAIAGMDLNLESIRMKANQVRDELLQFFGFDYVDVLNIDTGEYESQLQWFAEALQQNLVDKFPQWTGTINALFENWTSIITSFKGVFKSIVGVIDLVRSKLGAFASGLNLDPKFADGIGSLADNLDRISTWITEHSDLLANLTIIIGSIVAAFGAFNAVSGIVSGLSSAFGTIVTVVSKASSVFSAVSGAIGGLSAPVLLIVAGILALVAAFIYLWNTSDSFKEAVIEGVQSLVQVLQNFWGSILQPILQRLGTAMSQLWESALKPVIQRVIDIIGQLVELLMALWNNVLAPLVNWLVTSLGPSIADVFGDAFDIISVVIGNIISIIDGLLQILSGVLEFLTGVFTGDWEKAWNGLVNIFVGIGNTLISVFELVINGIINLVNAGISLIVNGIRGLINMVLGAVEGIAGLLGFNLNIKLEGTVPQIPPVSIPRIPAMATGGVVTGPTAAFIGEGRYDEAVIPLGNSPQMQDMIDRIVDATAKRDTDEPIQVNVYIGNEKVAEYMTRAERKRRLQTNGG